MQLVAQIMVENLSLRRCRIERWSLLDALKSLFRLKDLGCRALSSLGIDVLAQSFFGAPSLHLNQVILVNDGA